MWSDIMFNGKKERILEEELEKERQLCEKRGAALKAVHGKKEDYGRQLARAMDAQKKIAEYAGQMKESADQITDLTKNGAETAADIHGELIRMNNTIESFDANHSVFLGKMKEQNDRAMEYLEKERKLGPAAKEVSDLTGQMQENVETMKGTSARMLDFSKDMSVICLNAALEAGRMGENGSRFVVATEDVRSLAEQYENAVREMNVMLDSYQQRANDLTEKVRLMESMIKEQTASFTKMTTAMMTGMGDYKNGQLDLHGIVQESVIGRSDALIQLAQDVVKLNGELSGKIEKSGEETNRGKEALLDLDKTAREIFTAVKDEQK